MKIARILRRIFLVIFAFIMCFSAFQIVKIYRENHASDTLNDSLINEAVIPAPTTPVEDLPETHIPARNFPISVNFSVLHQKNKDVIAWVYCPDTVISYPIAQSEDNDYYLRRLLDGKKNTAGTLFADFRNASDLSDFYTVVYGHNMKNGSMFGILPEYKSQDFYENHPIWYLLTPEERYIVELVAGYVTPSDTEFYSIGNTKEDRDLLLTEALEKSTFQSGTDVSDTDKLVVFSTCSKEYQNARYVLVGVLKQVDKS